jgi:hypothetical protein
VLLALTAVVSCQSNSISGDAWDALESSSSFEIVSLEPSSIGEKHADMLYYWRVIGRGNVTSKSVKEKLVAALRDSIEDEPVGASCFDPRHAIRVSNGGHDYDFLICFSCGYLYWYLDGTKQETVLIGDAGATTFNKEFKAAGLTIAP